MCIKNCQGGVFYLCYIINVKLIAWCQVSGNSVNSVDPDEAAH